jgi:hypothetical protein
MWFGGGEKHRGGDARSSGSPFCGQGCVDRGGKGKGGPVRWRTERGGGPGVECRGGNSMGLAGTSALPACGTAGEERDREGEIDAWALLQIQIISKQIQIVCKLDAIQTGPSQDQIF